VHLVGKGPARWDRDAGFIVVDLHSPARNIGTHKASLNLGRRGRRVENVVRSDVVQHRARTRLKSDGSHPNVRLERVIHLDVLVFHDTGGGHAESWKFDDDIRLAECDRPFRSLASLRPQDVLTLAARRARLDPVDQSLGLLRRERRVVCEVPTCGSANQGGMRLVLTASRIIGAKPFTTS